MGCNSAGISPERVLSKVYSPSGTDLSSVGVPWDSVSDRKLALAIVSPWAALWMSVLAWSFMDYRKTASISTFFSLGFRGTCLENPLPSFTDPSFCWAVSCMFFHFLAQLPHRVFLPFLKHIGNVPSALLVGSTLASGAFVLEPAGVVCAPHRDSS